jgi:transcriptional regulator with XRE-family HTH domain
MFTVVIIKSGLIMKSGSKRTYSRVTREASSLLGKLIKLARKERNLTASDLADRAGITRYTLQKIEDGALTCEIGLVLEVATIVGVKLFDNENSSLNLQVDTVDNRIALLPKYVRKTNKVLDDDF